jgi:NTP pyrophosphatase (non-canonical NTP hydrolase)
MEPRFKIIGNEVKGDGKTYIASPELKERFGDNEFGEKDIKVIEGRIKGDDQIYWIAYPVSQEQESQEDLLLLMESLVEKHSLCPNNKLYTSNALAGEVGEIANIVKKIQMVQLRPEWVTQPENNMPPANVLESRLSDELGDALFYLVRLAKDNGIDLRTLIYGQEFKLKEQSEQYGRTFLK